MEVIEIAETASSPGIILDPEKNKFVFTGRSLPEDPLDFYNPVMVWMEKYRQTPIEGAVFEFKLNYFNTASSKVFFSLFQVIDKINLEHTGVDNRIAIYTSEDDEDLIELFEYYNELLSSNCLELKII